MVLGIYDDTMQAGNATSAVEKFADYLIKANY